MDGTSLDEQRRRCTAAIEAKGWQVAGEFTDAGVSGKRSDRPEWQRMLAGCAAGAFDAVVTLKLDRFGRSAGHAITEIDRLVDLGVAFVCVEQQIDLSTSAGRMMRTVLAGFAEFEASQIAERGVSGQRRKAQDGRWPGGSPPFGWRLDGSGRSATPVPDEREREVLRVAFQAVVHDGMSTGETAALLNGLGLFSRGRPSGPRTPWTHQRLRRQLEAEGLTGEVWWGKRHRKHGAGHNTTLKKDGTPKYGDPIRIDLPDPALTVEQFQALQAALARRAYGVKRPDKPYPNSGAATVCGGRLGGVYRVERDLRQYRCSNAKWRAGVDERCACPRIDADWLDGQVWGAISGLLADPDALASMADDWLGLAAERAEGDADVLATLDRKIAQAERAVTTTAVDALKAGLRPELMQAAVAELELELEALRGRREAVEAHLADAAARTDRAEALRRLSEHAGLRLRSLPLAEQREVLGLLRLRVSVLDASARPELRLEGELFEGSLLSEDAEKGSGCPLPFSLSRPAA